MVDKMKKVSFFLLVILFAFYGLTSCLDKGKDESTGYVVGVLDRDEANGFYTLSITDTSYVVYCPEFEEEVARHNMEAGGCYYVVYSKDNTLPENASHKVLENGYITASLIDYKMAAKYNLSESFIDTSVVLTDEMPVLDVKPSDQVFGYADGYLFMTHKISAQEGYTFDWFLSYNEETMMPTEADNKNYYNLFLRATIAGRDDTRTDTVEHLPLNAYYLKDYLMEAAIKEKEALILDSVYNEASTFTVRINYVSGITEDVITWKNAEFPAKISYFLPE